MSERPQPTFDPDAAARAVADHLPEVVTPQIDIQDLEHKPSPETRVSRKGVAVEPPGATPNREPHIDMTDFEKEDEKARSAVAEFEEQFAKLPPG